LGVRLRRGGGRGAGPGFMNWSREYMLALEISGRVGRWQVIGAGVGGWGLERCDDLRRASQGRLLGAREALTWRTVVHAVTRNGAGQLQ
jgi:hypothetical protein